MRKIKHILKSNYLRKRYETNLKMNQMLELGDKDFKLSLITILQKKKKKSKYIQIKKTKTQLKR